MKYEKPKCDCGTELIFWRQDICDVETPITKTGFTSKVGIKKDINKTVYYTRLHCPNCGTEYEDKYDNAGRVIRGIKY